MKNKALLVSAFVVLTFVACQKDDSGMLSLSIEGMNGGSKMVVDGNVSYWATGDKVNINGTTATINISTSGNTTTTAVSVASADAFYGVYPASICGNNNGASYTLNLPSSYIYATTTLLGRTYQSLQTPMVGYTESSNMQFKHVTAALNVKVTNYHYDYAIVVDTIVVSSTSYRLCGPTSITIGEEINVDAAALTETDADSTQSVTMFFDGGASLQVAAGSSSVVQIPILPVGAGNKFTVKISVHRADNATVKASLIRTQATGGAMARATLGYVPYNLGGPFSVASDKKVIFSMGNLQYQASSGIWRFAEHQYDAIGNNAGNSVFGDGRSTQDKWIDLFGWGTNGQNHGNTYYKPYDYLMGNATYAYGYGPKSGSNVLINLTVDSLGGDWGVNAINNGGNVACMWRTLTQEQVNYLMTRSNVSKRFAKAKVCGVSGLIILPDDYVHPYGVRELKAINTAGNGGWSSNIYYDNESVWNKMEIAGAVFLPITGRLDNSNEIINNTSFAYYWTSSQDDSYANKCAYCLYFGNAEFSMSTAQKRYYGCAVRLVRDVQ